MNWGRIGALVARHILLYRRNLSRLFEIFFWPLADLVLWGFISLYLTRDSGQVPLFVSFFLGAIIFWGLLSRSTITTSVSFLEDIWTRNLLNLFASPLKPQEFLVAIISTSFLQAVIGFVFLFILAFLLYSFNIFSLGIALVFCFANLLVMGWSIGIVNVSLILRFGQTAEILAWAVIFVFQPFSAVFYPVSVLPSFFQAIARFVPASHVFEGMRAVISTGVFPTTEFLWATGLNIIYATIAIMIFTLVFRQAKRQGRLTRMWQ